MTWLRVACFSFAVLGLSASPGLAQYWITPAPDYHLSQRPPLAIATEEPTAPSPSDQIVRPPAPHEYADVPSVRDILRAEAAAAAACQPDCRCSLCFPGEPWRLVPENPWGTRIGGWAQAGYHNKDDGRFNSHPGRLHLHQGYVYMQKAADGRYGWDWGFRADFIYGVDGPDLQAFGNHPGRWDYQNGFDHGIYGWAIPQAYGELAHDNLAIRFGHFYSPVGYEALTAPDRFFYSHAYTRNRSEPFTHTGVLAAYDVGERLTVYAGWTLGWDTGFDQRDQGNNFLGGFSYDLTDNVAMTYFACVGNLGWRGEGYNHSLVFDVALTERLNYVFQTDHVTTDAETKNNDIGINQYLLYQLNRCWAIGGRLEWWRQDSASLYEATAGLNWRPHPNFVLRPEIRYNWGQGIRQNIREDLSGGWIFGIDGIVTF